MFYKTDLSTVLKKSSSASSNQQTCFPLHLHLAPCLFIFFALLISQFPFSKGHSKSSNSGKLWRDENSYITYESAFLSQTTKKTMGRKLWGKKVKKTGELGFPVYCKNPQWNVVQMDPRCSAINVSSKIQRPKYHFSLSLCLGLFFLCFSKMYRKKIQMTYLISPFNDLCPYFLYCSA